MVPNPVSSAEKIAREPELVAEASSDAKEREAFAMLPLPSVDRLQRSAARMQEPRLRHHSKIVKKRAPTPSVAMARHLQFGWFERSFW
jgi:hypothetical protein